MSYSLSTHSSQSFHFLPLLWALPLLVSCPNVISVDQMSALKYPKTLFTSHYLCFAIYNLLFMIDLITDLLFTVCLLLILQWYSLVAVSCFSLQSMVESIINIYSTSPPSILWCGETDSVMPWAGPHTLLLCALTVNVNWVRSVRRESDFGRWPWRSGT